MIRYWMLAVLIGMNSGVTEAGGRNRISYNQGGSRQYQSPMRYTTGTNQAVYSPAVSTQDSQNGSQQQIQPASYSTNGTSMVQGNSMQAWAEEEARLMASRGTCGHVRSAPMGYFVGVGCGQTCMGSGRLVGQASYMGKTVRVWQR